MVDVTKTVATFLRNSPEVTSRVFENRRPREVAECITVVANGGTIIGDYMETADSLLKKSFIIYIRGTNYPSMMLQVQQVFSALKNFTVWDSSGNDICYGIKPVGSFEPLGVDDLGRSEGSLMYNLYVKE